MRILEVDSQILNAIQLCAEKHKLNFEENLTTETKAPALEMGSLLHKVMELYDGLAGNCFSLEAETWQELASTELLSDFSIKLSPSKEEIISFCISAGEIFASKMALSLDDAALVLYQCKEYFEYYRNDPWQTLAVEEIASKVLFENEVIQIVYTGKLDRLVQMGNVIAPMDHKSSSKRGETSSLSNQFIGYCFLLQTNNIIIDKIGFQKTLSQKERFQRIVLTIDDERIEEWKNNSIDSILSHLSLSIVDDTEARYYFNLLRERRNLKPLMNLTSCDKYSGCTYRSICEGSPEGRDWTKERDFVPGKKWDVGSILEVKE